MNLLGEHNLKARPLESPSNQTAKYKPFSLENLVPPLIYKIMCQCL